MTRSTSRSRSSRSVAPVLGERVEAPDLAGHLGQLALERDALTVHLVQFAGLDLELLDALLVEVAVGDHVLHLPVEQAKDLVVLRAKRPGAGGAIAFRARLDDTLALVLQLLVLIQQALTLGPRVLRVPHPGRAHVLAFHHHAGERRTYVAHARSHGIEVLAAGQPPQTLFDRGEVASHVLELGEQALPRRICLGVALESGHFLPERRQGCEALDDVLELLSGGTGLGDLPAKPLGPLGPGLRTVGRDPELRLELERGLALPLQALPARAHLGHDRVGGGRPFACRLFGRLRGRRALSGARLRCLDLGEITQGRPKRVVARAKRGAPLLQAVLGRPDPLVAQDARQELRALGRGHRRHDGELFLPRKVGVEEFFPRHGEQARHPLGHGPDRVRDRRRIAILVQLGAVQGAEDTVLMRAEAEFHLDLHARPGRRAAPANGLAAATRRGHAVHRPRDGLENGRLAGAVRADDAGQARAEHQLGMLVLAKIGEPQPVDLHQPASSRSMPSMRLSPSRTNASRSSSAGSGRRSR